jgi:ketosteroid isomerase-like protein
MRPSLIALPPLVVLASLAAGCGGHNPRAAREELLAVDEHLAAEVAEQGISVFERYYAEDAVELPSFEPIIEGKSAILDFYRPYSNNPSFKLTWKPTRAEVSEDGGLGFTYGHYQATTADDQGNLVTRAGKYITIWRREYDGGWKIILDGGSPDQREAPPGAAPAPAVSSPAVTPAPAAPGAKKPPSRKGR